MTEPRDLRLGINVDHVATLRNARGGTHPDPVAAARLAEEAGADGITAHLREDRRHVTDDDMRRIRAECGLPLNFEMAATEEMQRIALGIQPHAVCLVPESRQELTTEGGLNVTAGHNVLATYIPPFRAADIRVSLFIDPDEAQIRAASAVGADIVELHTGTYSNVRGAALKRELERLAAAARLADELGLEVHAGHGLTFDNVEAVTAIPEIVELNIGHYIIGDAVFEGLAKSIHTMKRHMNKGRFGE
jgi:pyridoxine 5-phosphate synthase